MPGAFLSLLLGDPNARKIFGRRELKIIEKQLEGVRLTQSEKNRLSRDVRRKFEFIRRAARFEGEFGLKKGSEVRRKTSDALDAALSDKLFPAIRRVWLFGSAASGERTLSSDIDIAVEFGHGNMREWADFRNRVSGGLPKDIDVQVLNSLPQKVRKEVLGKGRILYERKKDG